MPAVKLSVYHPWGNAERRDKRIIAIAVEPCMLFGRYFSGLWIAALALDRKKLAAFSALGGGFLRFPIGDRRCNRTRASVGNAGGNALKRDSSGVAPASRTLALDRKKVTVMRS